MAKEKIAIRGRLFFGGERRVTLIVERKRRDESIGGERAVGADRG